MRSKTWSYSPVTASRTGYLSNATGATWTLSNTATTDTLAHKVTIIGDAATDHSAKTAVIVGTDADGKAQTETVNLPNGTATVTSTYYYKTVTSVTPSATINADTMDIGWAEPSVGPTIPINAHSYDGSGYIWTEMIDVSGTISCGTEACFRNVFETQPSTLTWIYHGVHQNRTADAVGYGFEHAYAVRVQVNTVTNGATLKFTVVHGS